MEEIINTNESDGRITYNGYQIEPREVIWHGGKRTMRYVVLDADGSTTGNAAISVEAAKRIIDRLLETAKMLKEIEEINALTKNLPEVRDFVAVRSNQRKLGRYTQAEIDAMLV